MTRKILKHWALFYKNGERHFINAPTRAELDSAIFEGAYAPRFDSVTYYVEVLACNVHKYTFIINNGNPNTAMEG